MSHIGQNLEIPATVGGGEINLTTNDLQNPNRAGGRSDNQFFRVGHFEFVFFKKNSFIPPTMDTR